MSFIRNNSPETKRNEQKDDLSGMLGGNAKEGGVVWCGVCVSLSALQINQMIRLPARRPMNEKDRWMGRLDECI